MRRPLREPPSAKDAGGPRTLADLLAGALRPFHFRGKARLLHGLCPREGERSFDLFGVPVRLDLRNHIERSIYLGVYEPEETRLVSRHLREGMTVFDVGANVGYYTLLASRLVGPRGRVVAFEPAPYPLGKLREWTKELPNVTVEEVALGRADGRGVLFPSPGVHNRTANMAAGGKGPSVNVGVRSLDSYVREHGIARVDLLKVDVDGYETEIVEGARESLSSGAVRAVLCEFSRAWLAHAGSSPADLLETFRRLGLKPQSRFSPSAELQNVLLVRDAA